MHVCTHREGTDNGYMPMRSYQKRSNQTGKAHPKKVQAKYSHFYHQLSLFYTFQSVSSLSEWCDDKDDLSLDTEDLLSFSYQVAKGMDFLTSKNVSVYYVYSPLRFQSGLNIQTL